MKFRNAERMRTVGDFSTRIVPNRRGLFFKNEARRGRLGRALTPLVLERKTVVSLAW